MKLSPGISTDLTEVAIGIPDRQETGPTTPGFLRIAHMALRGRYIYIGALSAGMAILAGWLGWRSVRPEYTSEGLVQIHSSIPVVRELTDQNAPIQMFDQFMMSQRTLITSRRVTDIAVDDPIWKASGEQPPANPAKYFSDRLTVDIKPRNEFIHLSIKDTNPGMAAAAVTAIINAYSHLYKMQDEQQQQQRIGLLADELKLRQSWIADQESQIWAKAKTYGTTNLDYLFDSATMRVTSLQAALTVVQEALAGAVPDVTKPSQTPPQPIEMDPSQIAHSGDQTMAGYLNRQFDLEQQLAVASRSLGDQHPKVAEIKIQLETLGRQIDEYAKEYRQKGVVGGVLTGDLNRNAVNLPPEVLRSKNADLQAMLDKANEDMRALGTTRNELRQMDADLAKTKLEVTELTHRIEVLRGEDAMGERLEVIGTGEIPISPSTDQRPKTALMFGSMGACIPLAIVIALYMLTRRYRYADETTSDTILGSIPLLGLLPEVRSKGEHIDLMRATAHGVHHLRVLLSSQPRQKHVYLITSAAEGEGKTSLVVALGMSIAATKKHTLLIDADFVGQRMTQGFDMSAREGLHECLQEGSIKDRARRIDPNLDVLPCGLPGPSGAFAVTSEAIRTFMESIRGKYDTIIFDSGPIMGSLEASMLSQEVDGVIITVSRGQHQSLLESAMRRLNSLGAKVAGVVFNRAKLRDFQYSSYSSTTASIMAQPNIDGSPERSTSYSKFGPIVRAVAMATPTAA